MQDDAVIRMYITMSSTRKLQVIDHDLTKNSANRGEEKHLMASRPSIE